MAPIESILDPQSLRELIAERDISRGELSKAAGISESYLSRIVNEKIRISKPELIGKLAQSLAVDPGDLVRGWRENPVRVAAPPHLWSAPFLNLPAGAKAAGHGFDVLSTNQSYTGADALHALRRGDADLALAFETPLSLTDDSDVVPLGSICTGSDFVRLLIHRQSPLLEEFERLASKAPSSLEDDSGPELPDTWRERPTAAIHGHTIAVDYLQHLETRLPALERVRLVERRAGAELWQDDAGRPLHLVLIWEPVASAVVSASEGQFVDVFDAFAGRLPTMLLPSPAEYQLLVSLERRLAASRLTSLIGDLHTAVKRMNHFIGSARLILGNQPVVDRLVASLGDTVEPRHRSDLRQRLVHRLAGLEFQLRIRPEIFTKGLL